MRAMWPLWFNDRQPASGIGLSNCREFRAYSVKEENGIVTGVKLHGGKVIKSEVVILATGYRPETDLAKKAVFRCLPLPHEILLS